MLWGGTPSVHGYPLVFNLGHSQNSPESNHIVKRENPVLSRSTLTHFSDGQQPAYTQPLQHGELTENSIDKRACATSPLHLQHCDNASVHLWSPVPLATTAWGQQSASAL